MITIAEDKVEDLLVCLETDSEHIQESLSQLNELRSLVIKRDDVALGRLLESIQAESQRHRNQQQRRQSIRKDLANALECGIEQMTLSKLEQALPKTMTGRVSRMKVELKSLIEAFRKEYLSTVLLLSECSRLNGMILKSIFKLGRTGEVYYNANGLTKRQTETAFVDIQF